MAEGSTFTFSDPDGYIAAFGELGLRIEPLLVVLLHVRVVLRAIAVDEENQWIAAASFE